MKVGALVQFREARDAAHVAAGANRCAEVVCPIAAQALQVAVEYFLSTSAAFLFVSKAR